MVILKHWRHLTQKTKYKIFLHTDHNFSLFFFGNKTIKSKINTLVGKIGLLRFCPRIYKEKKTIETNTLNKKPDYKNLNKLINTILVKNGNYMQIAKATKKNENVIKNAHDSKLVGYPKKLKTQKKNHMEKHQGKCKKIHQELPNIRDWEIRSFSKKKNYIKFCNHRKHFSKNPF